MSSSSQQDKLYGVQMLLSAWHRVGIVRMSVPNDVTQTIHGYLDIDICIVHDYDQEINVMVIGDGAVGKTTLLYSFYNGGFDDQLNYVPMVDASDIKTKICGDYPTKHRVNFKLMDICTKEDYDRLRPLGYKFVNIFLVCFALNSMSSYQNIKTKWIRELRRLWEPTDARAAWFADTKLFYWDITIPIILCGTKCDLKNDNQFKDQCIGSDLGNKLCDEIGATQYIECSSFQYIAIEHIFDQCFSEFNKWNKSRPQTSKKGCILL